MKLMASQMAAKLGITSYTLKRWYEFYRDLTEDEIIELEETGMPRLPEYEVIKYEKREDKVWDEKDIDVLTQFKNWVPPTSRGIFQKYKKKENM